MSQFYKDLIVSMVLVFIVWAVLHLYLALPERFSIGIVVVCVCILWGGNLFLKD